MRDNIREGTSGAVDASVVHRAMPDDAAVLARLATVLAAHHGDQATTDPDRLRADLFAPPSLATALVAERSGAMPPGRVV